MEEEYLQKKSLNRGGVFQISDEEDPELELEESYEFGILDEQQINQFDPGNQT